MKSLMLILAALLAVSFTTAPDARPSKKKVKKVYRSADTYKTKRVYRSRATRPYSIGHNGLCQRDTGTPTSQLNFRVGCDVEEFWRRQEELGGGIR